MLYTLWRRRQKHHGSIVMKMPFDLNQKGIAATWIAAYFSIFAFTMIMLFYTFSWIVAQPIEELSTSNLRYDSPPSGT